MQTDIPLKRLTLLRAADLLPLLGLPHAELVAVETLELPASAARLDNVLLVRSPQGHDYLHVVEWQGYRDPGVLWRMAGYLAWLGQRDPALTIIGTLVYLTPGCDIGDTIRQQIDGLTAYAWPVRCVRLWEQNAGEALASGSVGLAVLSPLMRNADQHTVEQAIGLVLHEAPRPQQADLLSILGVLAEPLLAPERFLQLVGKERLMESTLLEYLVAEKAVLLEQHARVGQLREDILEALATRFNPPAQNYRQVEQAITVIDELNQLSALFRQALLAADFAAFVRELPDASALSSPED